MASPAFFWYPAAGKPLRITDFGEEVSDLQPSPDTVAADEYAWDGRAVRLHVYTNERVRIVLERFGGPGPTALEREFRAIERHLHLGGWVGFSSDADKAWAAQVTTLPVQGDTTLRTAGTGFSAWASATLAATDEITIESVSPEDQQEVVTLASFASPYRDLALSEAVRCDYLEPTIVRYRHFWPCLRLPQDQLRQSIVPSDHGLNYTLDLTLEASVSAVVALYPSPSTVGGVLSQGRPNLMGTSRTFGGSSLEGALGDIRADRAAAALGSGPRYVNPWRPN